MNPYPDIAYPKRADPSYAGNAKDAMNNSAALNIVTGWKGLQEPGHQHQQCPAETASDLRRAQSVRACRHQGVGIRVLRDRALMQGLAIPYSAFLFF